jgi:hypothetical protein
VLSLGQNSGFGEATMSTAAELSNTPPKKKRRRKKRVCRSDNRYFEGQVPAKAEICVRYRGTAVTQEHTKSGRWEGKGWQSEGQVVGGKRA